MSPTTLGKDTAGEVAFLARELKTPVIAEMFESLGDQARTEGRSDGLHLAAALRRQMSMPSEH